MEKNFESDQFCKVLLTGLFAGIFATVASILYDILFCYYTGFPYATIINISTIIFSVPILVVISGLIYYYLVKAAHFGTSIFIGIYLAITFLLLLKIPSIQRSVNYHENVEFRELLSGILIITGVSCFLLIPMLIKNKAFNKHVV